MILSLETAPRDPRFDLTRRELGALAARLGEALGLTGEFELTVVDDAAMAALNTRAMGLPGPTNVLAFPSGEGEGGPAPRRRGRKRPRLGEIVLSADTLAREAFLYGQEPREHLARLLAHALLHLAGHDHGPAMDELTDLAVAAATADPAD